MNADQDEWRDDAEGYSMKLLVIEGNTASARAAANAAGLMSQSELYVATLHKLAPGVDIEVICPTDPESQLPAGARLEDYDGIVWTGSSLNVYDRTPEIERQVGLMRTCFERGTRIFGSCWGLQVAAVATGGVVCENVQGREIGIARMIRLTEAGRSHPMYVGKSAVFDAVAIHLDHITTAPEGCVVLAHNEKSAIQAAEIRRGDAIFWGVQYHPEFDLAYIAGTMRRYAPMMIREGFCRDTSDVEQLTGDFLETARDGDRADLRWRYGIGPDILDESRRRVEIGNWLSRLKRS